MPKCPGQDKRFWKPKDIFEVNCTKCGASVEFWKDDPKLKCPRCGSLIVNPKLDLSCAEWCKYAKQCLGTSSADNILCNALIGQMKKVFADDLRRMDHALEVLKYAEKIQIVEGGDPLVVKAAAILHDIGIPKARSKHNSAAAEFHQIEGPVIAREILTKHGVETELIEHICKIIASYHSAEDIDTTEFRIVRDADWLVNFPEEFGDINADQVKEEIDRIFKTQQGRLLAIELFAE